VPQTRAQNLWDLDCRPDHLGGLLVAGSGFLNDIWASAGLIQTCFQPAIPLTRFGLSKASEMRPSVTTSAPRTRSARVASKPRMLVPIAAAFRGWFLSPWMRSASVSPLSIRAAGSVRTSSRFSHSDGSFRRVAQCSHEKQHSTYRASMFFYDVCLLPPGRSGC